MPTETIFIRCKKCQEEMIPMKGAFYYMEHNNQLICGGEYYCECGNVTRVRFF